MKLLIIGNGFDLSNGLPTRYSEFLGMCKIACYPYIKYFTSEMKLSGLSEEESKKHVQFCKTVGKEYFYEFVSLARENLFVSIFLHRRAVLGDKWLNFEEEIERFISEIIQGMHAAPDEKILEPESYPLSQYCYEHSSELHVYKDLFKAIKNEHNNLIRALEIYMDGYVNQLPVKKISGFKKGFYDHVLSFNYTDTYAEKYEPELGCCYIHGKACVDKSKPCEMVLGFDDRYKNPNMTELEMLPYEKFFQRLDLGTSNEYMDWLDEMEHEKDNIVDIFGHSLAQADADVLKAFIDKPNTKTRIFYFNDTDRYDKMRNLTMILGSDKTVRMVGGRTPNIFFISQNDYSTSI